jgi:hypothetical protein
MPKLASVSQIARQPAHQGSSTSMLSKPKVKKKYFVSFGHQQ